MSRELRLPYAKTGATVYCYAYYNNGGSLTVRDATPVTMTEDLTCIYGGDASEISGLTNGDLLVYWDNAESVPIAEETYLGFCSGIGAIEYTYTTKEADDTPISNVEVWVTTSESDSQTNIIASGVTSDLGIVTFYLDAGTYYFWHAKGGYTFNNPETEVVSS